MDKTFTNKVALVTGASFGIGRATAIAFAQRGASVVVADWKEDPESTTLKAIKEAGSEGLFIRCNVASASEVSQLVSLSVERFGRLDFAFNNAGIEGVQASTLDCTEENWDNTLAVNLKGVWLCMKEELKQMQRQGSGVIVNCSSVAGLSGFANLPAYVASKHGIIGLTKAAGLENAKTGVRINAVCPGVIRTQMVERITGGNPEAEKQYIAMEPVGRMGKPEEVAEAVVWLCSDSASFITGVAIPVDGGFLAG